MIKKNNILKKIIQKKINIILTLILILIISISVTNAKSINSKKSIEEKIESEGKSNVIIRIIDKKAGKNENKNLLIQNILENKKELKIINAYAGVLNKENFKKIKNLEKQEYIIEIYEDKKIKLTGTIDDKNFRTSLDTSVNSIGANYSHNILNITGRNVTVAVIDSGIYYNHTDLGGGFGPGYKVKGGYDFVNNDNDPLDDNGHGTHIAGIIGANGVIKGVAPDVELLAIKSCDDSGVCYLSDIISGIEWAVNNDADIISMSLGGSYSDTPEGNSGKDSVSLAVEAAIASGKPVIIAVGNSGPGISTVNVPAAAENAITVGSVDDKNTITQLDDTVTTISARGPSAFGRLDPEIVAPGVGIYSTYLNNNYQSMSGTSMAAPHVTGIVALMLEQNPYLTPSEIRRILINSAVNISDYVFNVGSGEVNAINALTYNISAIIKAKNSYNVYVSNDRWEFIAPIQGTEYANITIINNNSYDINFTLILTNFYNSENLVTLNESQFEYPKEIIVSANSVASFNINFTTYDFNNIYATTYGGKLLLLGNDSKNISIPIIVTIPIKNYANIIRTFINSGAEKGDVLFYAYYNNKSGNEKVEIKWSNTSSNLDLYVYNSTADIHVYGGYSNTNNETLYISSTDSIKWIRIHAYNLNVTPFNFSINITDLRNIPPNIINVTNEYGTENFNYSLLKNITIIAYFNDIDNDTLIIDINDSRYNKTINKNNATFLLENNISLLGTHPVRISVTDEYGETVFKDINIKIYTLTILNYSPSNTNIIVKKNDTINFTQTMENSEDNLYYYWYINGTLNSTEENFTLDTSYLTEENYNITFLASNNIENITVNWNLTIDDEGPIVNIVRPLNLENNSILKINITAQDISGVNKCWYNITGNNTIISNTITCGLLQNITLTNGNYTIHAYANDSYGFIGYNNKTFTVSDIIPPEILSLNPSGSLSYRESVTLEVNLNENSVCKYDEDNVSYSNMSRPFSTTGTINKKTISVDGGKSYLLYVKCADLAGNVNAGNYYFNFSIKEEKIGSSNTGSGSSLIDTTPTNNIQQTNSKSFFYSEIKNNFTINIDSDNISIKKIIVYINNKKTNVDIKIIDHGLNNNFSIVNSINNDIKKYTLLEIKHNNLENEDILMSKIQFSVSKRWIKENNINENSIKIYRYTTSWNEIPAIKLSEDNNKIIYEATMPGLSYLIVGGKQNTIQQNPKEQTSPQEDNINKTNEETIENVLERKNLSKEKPLKIINNQKDFESKFKVIVQPTIIIIVIALIIIITTANIIVKKKKNEEILLEKQRKIEELKKQYVLEQNQLIQEYITKVKIIGKDRNAQQKISLLRDYYNNKIKELHKRYSQMIEEIKNFKN